MESRSTPGTCARTAWQADNASRAQMRRRPILLASTVSMDTLIRILFNIREHYYANPTKIRI